MKPLQNQELRAKKKDIQSLATKQLLHTWTRAKERQNDPFLWGDELECFLVHLNHERQEVQTIRTPMNRLETFAKTESNNPPSLQPEFGSFMLETTPAQPFGEDLHDLLRWEEDFRRRRQLVNKALGKDEYLVTIPYLPRFGAQRLSSDRKPQDDNDRNGVTQSSFVPDEMLTENTRYRSVAENIIMKRGDKVHIDVPVFRDSNTSWPWRDPTICGSEMTDVRENHIYMDTIAFGAGGCSLQVTMQAPDIEAARLLHDQLVPLAPIMLALTAGTPIFRGFLADVDTRWRAFEQSVDDRTKPQREGVAPGPRWSRVSTSTTYISADTRPREQYQFPKLQHDPDVKMGLLGAGMDDHLATHFAHLFARDPLSASAEGLDNADVTKTEFSSGLLSNVYQLVRFKPPSDEETGRRVEIRPMEAQLTDFENAAFCVFTILVAKTILTQRLDFCIPLEKVEQNMAIASNVDAATIGKFWFRSGGCGSLKGQADAEPQLMTANEIINGSDHSTPRSFPGILPLVEQYIAASKQFNSGLSDSVGKYLNLIRERASGQNPTNARRFRRFVASHPGYNHNSIIPERVAYDLIRNCM